MAAALLAASALAASGARADSPFGAWRSWVAPGAPRLALAGATLRNLNGWSASLFVTRALADPALADEGVQVPDSTAVNARLARRISRSTRLTLDVFNLFDRRADPLDAFVASSSWAPGGMPEDFLVHPGEPRGVRLSLRWTFR